MGDYTGAVFIDPIKKETGKPMPVLNLDALYESVKNSEDIIEAGVRSAGIVQDFLKNTYVPNIDFSKLPELMKDFDILAQKTRIPKSRLLDEAIEDLLKKYHYEIPEK